MKIVAQMVVRNEVDVIEECLSSIAQWVDEIVILDGESDDGTLEKIESFDGLDIDLTSQPDPGGQFIGGLRQDLLDLTRRHNPDWIVSLDADEIYETNPVPLIGRADASGANVIRAYIPQFWITVDDVRCGILTEDRSLPIQERRRWYSWGHMGTFVWKDLPDHYYPQHISKRTPELPGKRWKEWQAAPNAYLIVKHYPFRTIGQAVKRAEERRNRGGRQYFGKYYHNWIIDETAVPLWHFDGTRWNTTRNHQQLKAYMAGELL